MRVWTERAEKHVLLDCRRWNAERQGPRTALRDRSRWGDMPYLLGSCSSQKRPTGPMDGWGGFGSCEGYHRLCDEDREIWYGVDGGEFEQNERETRYQRASGCEATC